MFTEANAASCAAVCRCSQPGGFKRAFLTFVPSAAREGNFEQDGHAVFVVFLNKNKYEKP